MNSTLQCKAEAIGNLLPQYELDMLSADEQIEFENHLLECAYCLNELRSFSATANLMLAEKEMLARELNKKGISFAALKRELIPAGTPVERKKSRESVWEQLTGWLRRPLNWAAAFGTAIVILLTTIFMPDGGSRFSQLLPRLAPIFTPIVIRGGGEAEREFGLAREAYNQKSFKDAIKHFSETVELDPQNGDAWLYLGISQYLRNDKAAIASLQRAETVVGGDAEKLAHARWYLALSYLDTEDVTNGLKKLNEVIAQNGPHAQEAQDLKVKLAAMK